MDDLPDNVAERAELLKNLLVAHATNGVGDNDAYRQLRAEFIQNSATKNLLPAFVRTCRDTGQFWEFIKNKFKHYRERREFLWTSFEPLLDYLEGKNAAPADQPISDALSSFDTEGVHALWEKALQRRTEDPEGAITLARSLLETVCKRILDEATIPYVDADELPQLYGKVAKALTLAPSQHTEDSFRAILGSCQQVVERLGTLRNKIGDAHGRGGKPIRPSPRHAALAVNLAGAMATFLVETWQTRQVQRS